jgi:site-specific DNA recombinase
VSSAPACIKREKDVRIKNAIRVSFLLIFCKLKKRKPYVMNAPKKVGIWIRVSTDIQVKDDSPEHHERRGRAYAEAKGWEVVEVYRLDAVSGKAVMEQPEAKRMLKDVRSGHITGLIFSKLARLARNTKELLEFAEIFKQYNADLISLAESIDTSTPAGRLFYTMIAAMATWEREEIAERVAASVPIRAKMGKTLGGAAPFGYKWEGKEWNGVRWLKKEFVVDEKEAPVRKLIYEYFLKLKRKKAVAAQLNKEGYRTRNGSKFSDTTIDRLIRDSAAKGQRLANYTKSLGEGKHWKMKPKEDWIIIPCEAIVSEDIWNQCNEILDSQLTKRRAGRRPVHLLSGYLECESCRKKMYIYHEKTPTYRCKFCKTSIPSDDLNEIFHEQLKSYLLADMNAPQYREKADAILQEKIVLLEKNQAESERLAKRMTNLVTMKLDGDLSKEAFQREYKPLEEQYSQLEKQLPDLEAEVDFLRIQHLSSDAILEEAKNLYERWPSLPFEEKRNIVEVITENIIIGKSDITINFSYQPTPHAQPSQNGGKKQRSLTDSSKRST